MEIQTTADGSSTIYLPELDEHYHSVNGAVQESRHVYINAGFNECKKDQLTVLELGFGTGLNALLTAMEAVKQHRKVVYISLEKFPLSKEVLSNLTYSNLNNDLFQEIHDAEWEKEVRLNDCFSLKKIKIDFSDYPFPEQYDVVYYDAFAPDKQAGVWTQELFDRISERMSSEAVLTTYCAKGAIRRMMQAAGLLVERIPGPPGKREMLRARK